MPAIDAIAPAYLDNVDIIAVAGKADFAATEARAATLFSDNIKWGLDESVWELYEVFGQPVSFLISHDDVIVDNWFGRLSDEELKARLDNLVALSA